MPVCRGALFRAPAQSARRGGSILKLGAALGLFAAAFGGLSFISSGASAETEGQSEAVTQAVAAESAAGTEAAATDPAADATDSAADADDAAVPENADAAQQDVEADGIEAITADSVEPGDQPEAAPEMAIVETVEESVESEAPAPAPAEAAPAQEQAPAAPEAPSAPVPAQQEPAPQAPAQSHWNVNVSCAGGQAEIDGCVGATNYTPAAQALGVPYYAQHDYLGGNAWWNIEPGHTVEAEGTAYVVGEVRVVATGGSSEQIEDMRADAFLQTCLEDGVHSRVVALVRV